MANLQATRQVLERSIDEMIHVVGIDDSCDASNVVVHDEHMRVLNDFVRGVSHASSGRLASPETLLAPLTPKGPALRFLVQVHKSRKLQRKRIAATVSLLLQVRPWLAALRDNATLCASLPEDLAGILSESGSQRTDSAGSEAQDNPASPRGAKPSAGVNLLRQATEEILSAVTGDQCITAFEHFRKAVTWIAQGGNAAECRGVLDSLEHKANILEFLTDFYEQKRKYRARVASALIRLLDFKSWRDVAVADPSIHASLRDLMADDSKASRADTFIAESTKDSNLDLNNAAAVAGTNGNIGVLYVRIIGASDLEGVGKGNEEVTSASFALFARVRVGAQDARTKRTEIACGTANPEWDNAPFLFNVPSLDVLVSIDIIDSDITKDDLLGSLRLPVADIPVMDSLNKKFNWQVDSLCDPARYLLHRNQGTDEAPCNQQCGELELDLWFCPSPGFAITHTRQSNFLVNGAVALKNNATALRATTEIVAPGNAAVVTNVTVHASVNTSEGPTPPVAAAPTETEAAVAATPSVKLATIKQSRSELSVMPSWQIRKGDIVDLLRQHSTVSWQRTACMAAVMLLGAVLIAWRRPTASRATKHC